MERIVQQDLNDHQYHTSLYEEDDELNPEKYFEIENLQNSAPNRIQDLNLDLNEEVLEKKFSNLLQCFICYKIVQKPVVCPSCSGFACGDCFKTWLVKQKRCPVCRHYIQVNNVLPCKFLSDMSQFLSLHDSFLFEKFKSYEKDEQNDLCQKHELKKLYFCRNCNDIICSDCGIFDKKHKNHKISRIKDIYKQKVQILNQKFNDLDQQVQSNISYVDTLNDYIQEIQKEKEKRNRNLFNFFNEMKRKLEQDFQIKMETLNEEKKKNLTQHKEFEDFKQKIQEKLSQENLLSIIKNDKEYVTHFKNFQEIQFQQNITKDFMNDFREDSILLRTKQSIVIKHFSRKKQEDQIIYGNTFEQQGNLWRLKIYPNGAGIFKNVFMSIFVELVKGCSKGGNYTYKISMEKLNQNIPGENLEKEYTSDFEDSVCWGYNRFYRLEDLQRDGYLIEEDDQLKINLEIGPSNLLQMAQDQVKYIATIEKDKQDMQKKIQNQNKEIKNIKKRFFNKFIKKCSRSVESTEQQKQKALLFSSLMDLKLQRKFQFQRKKIQQKSRSIQNIQRDKKQIKAKKRNKIYWRGFRYTTLSQNSLNRPSSIMSSKIFYKKMSKDSQSQRSFTIEK